ncbi:hypothetical protein [Aneurinibacillus thermoaerophilus]|uniref:hypothetical protein n=1 Tax=Aneurinibacillus thermoaerophilus TaxID=143495 RepID=UPI002E1BD97E|nr:hypothetical protein [Aneurinibacillus thermoaerophilus]
MKLQHETLRSHLEEYPFAFIEVKQEKNDWYVLSDRGKKRITYCTDENLLRWSHHWRECLAASGFRYVERYIATRSGTHWISDDTGCYALSDYWEKDDSWVRHPFWQMEGYSVLGMLLARIHACSDYKIRIVPGRYCTKGILTEAALRNSYRYLDTIMQNLYNRKSAEEKWLFYNLSRTVERVRMAEALYVASGVEHDATPLSFAYMELASLVRWEGVWYITGLHAPVLARRHEDTLSLLEQIWRAGGADGVQAFLSAYADERRLTVEERNYLLSLLAYPLPVLLRIKSATSLKDEQESIATGFRLQYQREQLLACVMEMHGLCGEGSD